MSAILEQAGLVTPAGQVVGVETSHPDAELLRLIAQFTVLNDTTWHLIRRAERLKADGRVYRRLWREALSSHPGRERLERAICATKARTRLGLIAKANLWLDIHADNTGTLWNLPKAVLSDAIALLDAIGEARA